VAQLGPERMVRHDARHPKTFTASVIRLDPTTPPIQTLGQGDTGRGGGFRGPN
jgi:hypothetical protein